MSLDSLMERLGAADPAMSATPDRDTVEAVLRQVFSADTSSASANDELAARGISGSRSLSGRQFGLGLRSTGPPRRDLKRWAAVGVAAVAAAVALLVVGTKGGGPASAFAGWTADPTRPAAGQLQGAESACAARYRYPSLTGLAPTLSDTRGPFSVLLYAQARTLTTCITGLPRAVNKGTVVLGGIPVPSATTIAPDSVRLEGIQFSFGSRATGSAARIVTGQTGSGVTAVTLNLNDGSSVVATTTNGWFAAWWPSRQGVRSADITTATGSTTQPLNLPTLPPAR